MSQTLRKYAHVHLLLEKTIIFQKYALLRTKNRVLRQKVRGMSKKCVKCHKMKVPTQTGAAHERLGVMGSNLVQWKGIHPTINVSKEKSLANRLRKI